MRTAAIWLMLLAFVAGSVWMEYRVWVECRSDHSFLYCLRVLGK